MCVKDCYVTKTKPICSQCGISMDEHMRGVTVVEMAHDPPTPRAMTMADEYKCRSCGCKVIGAFGKASFSRRHDDDFKSRLVELMNTVPMKIRVEWEYLPPANWQDDPVAYLVEWAKLEPFVNNKKE